MGGINQRVASPTRSEWLSRLESLWRQAGGPGSKTDAELTKICARLTQLQAEIAEESTQANESWKAVLDDYNEERQSLQKADPDWRQDALQILAGKHADTARNVQIADGYLTFDDLGPLEYALKEKTHRRDAQIRAERESERVLGPVAEGAGDVAVYAETAAIRSRRRRFTPSSGTRSWAIESRSRMVTAPSSSESTSTVTHHGVPISSWRR